MARFNIDLPSDETDGYYRIRDVHLIEARHVDRAEAVQLRDLLLQQFPLDGWGSPGELAALAEHGAHQERRERIASRLMGSALSHEDLTDAGVNGELSARQRFVPKGALVWADALIAELDKGE